MFIPEQIVPELFTNVAKRQAAYARRRLINDLRYFDIELAFKSPLFGRDDKRAIAILEDNKITIDNGQDALPHLLSIFYPAHIEWHYEQLTRPEGEMPITDINKDSGFIAPPKSPAMPQERYDEICTLETEAHRWGMQRITALFLHSHEVEQLYTAFAWSDLRYYLDCMSQPDPVAARVPPEQRLVKILESMQEALQDPSLCGFINPLPVKNILNRASRSHQQTNVKHIYINVL